MCECVCLVVCLICVFACVGGLAISGSRPKVEQIGPEVSWRGFSFRALLSKIFERNFIDKGWGFSASAGAPNV